MKFCVIADAALADKCKQLGYEFVDAEFLKNKISEKDKKGRELKKWSAKYKILFVSESLVRNLPKIGGPFFTRWGKFPTVIAPNDDITSKVNEGLSTIKFQLKKVTNLGNAIGHVKMSEEQVRQNLLLSVNFLVSLLKKGWNNLNSLTIRSTMGKPVKIY